MANLAGAVYGTIAVAALLAAESARQETYPRTVTAVVITLLLYWLAHSYSELAGQRLERHEKLTFSALWKTMVHEVPILVGAVLPLTAILIEWLVGASLAAAVGAAVWTSAVIIMAIEVVIGVRAELSGRELVAQATIGAVLGLFVIALRLLLH
jgi:hypothetical protein